MMKTLWSNARGQRANTAGIFGFSFFGVFAVLGFAAQAFVAWRFQSRAWIDEIWVFFNPAYTLLHHVGALDVDWVDGLRSWLPPLGLVALLKTLSAAGISKGTLVLPLVRLALGTLSFAAKLVFITGVARHWKLRRLPWIAAIFVFFAPEFLHYGALGDLAALALPFLLLGLLFLDAATKSGARAGIAGTAFLVLSCLIRYSFIVILFYALFYFALQKRRGPFLCLLGGLALFFCLDVAVNSIVYGRLHCPFLTYAYQDMVVGKPARDGVTPFYFGFELLWRFMTEPLLIAAGFGCLGCAAGPGSIFKRGKFLWGAALSLLFLHLFFGHKEYRYFYPIAVLMAALAGLSIQAWFEQKSNRRRRAAVTLLLPAFIFAALLRGFYKTSWHDYEIPSKLETWVGARADARGLLVYGWSGIYSGGHYTFHRTLPYFYAENKAALARAGLHAMDYNYVITGAAESAPCRENAKVEGGGAVYRCSPGEIKTLLGAAD